MIIRTNRDTSSFRSFSSLHPALRSHPSAFDSAQPRDDATETRAANMRGRLGGALQSLAPERDDQAEVPQGWLFPVHGHCTAISSVGE